MIVQKLASSESAKTRLQLNFVLFTANSEVADQHDSIDFI